MNNLNIHQNSAFVREHGELLWVRKPKNRHRFQRSKCEKPKTVTDFAVRNAKKPKTVINISVRNAKNLKLKN